MVAGNGGKDILPAGWHPTHGFWAGGNLDWKCCAADAEISVQKHRKGLYLLPISIVNCPVNSIPEAERWWTQAEAIGWLPLQPSIYCKHLCQSNEKTFRTLPLFLFLLLFFARELLLPRTRKKHVTLNWKPWKSVSLPANEQLAIETSSLAFISAGCWSIHEPLTWPL